MHAKRSKWCDWPFSERRCLTLASQHESSTGTLQTNPGTCFWSWLLLQGKGTGVRSPILLHNIRFSCSCTLVTAVSSIHLIFNFCAVCLALLLTGVLIWECGWRQEFKECEQSLGLCARVAEIPVLLTTVWLWPSCGYPWLWPSCGYPWLWQYLWEPSRLRAVNPCPLPLSAAHWCQSTCGVVLLCNIPPAAYCDLFCGARSTWIRWQSCNPLRDAAGEVKAYLLCWGGWRGGKHRGFGAGIILWLLHPTQTGPCLAFDLENQNHFGSLLSVCFKTRQCFSYYWPPLPSKSQCQFQ